jgi:hypothetical protein
VQQPSKEQLLHLALAHNQRKMLGIDPSGDLRMCRMFNTRSGKKEFCLAEFYGHNLSIPLMFFIDRPVPNVVQAAKEMCLFEISKPEQPSLIALLQELDDKKRELEGETLLTA